MLSSDPVWWISILLPTFLVFYAVAMILRNYAAKKDRVGKTKNDAIDSSVSIEPRKNTRKPD